MVASSAAVSADSRLLDLLRAGGLTARVQGVFDKAANLWCVERRQLFTLAASGSDDAPNTMVIDRSTFRDLGLSAATEVTLDHTRLVAENRFQLRLSDARPWAASIPSFPDLGPAYLARVTVELCRLLGIYGRPGGLRAAAAPMNDFEAESSRLLGVRSQAMLRALRDNDLPRAYAAGSLLIGLGSGLTPAGDDFLSGLAVVCAMPGGHVHTFQPFLAGLVADHEERTNTLSFTTMQEAVQGRVRQRIVDLLDAVSAGDLPSIPALTRRVIAIGSTSGTDMLTGMQAGLHLERELRGMA